MKPLLKRSLIILLAGLTITGIWTVIGIRQFLNTLPDAYGIWGTGELVIAYLEEKSEMPDSWEDLRPFWDAGHGMHARSGRIETLEDLMKIIDVKFGRFGEYQVAAMEGTEPPTIITVKSGTQTRWQNSDADEMIVDFLRKKND